MSYYLHTFLFSSLLVIVSFALGPFIFLVSFGLIFPAVMVIWLLWFSAKKFGQRKDLPSSFFARVFPLILPWWIAALAYVPLSFVVGVIPHDIFYLTAGYAYIIVSLLIFFPFFIFYSKRNSKSEIFFKSVAILTAVTAFCGLTAYYSFYWVRNNILFSVSYAAKHETLVGHDFNEGDKMREHERRMPTWHGVRVGQYMPFQWGETLAALPQAAGLEINANWPKLDGSIALLPIYGAAAKAVYTELDEITITRYVECNNTSAAFERLLEGRIDLYFGPPLSPAQRKEAAARGLDLIAAPVAYEAFVFLVHKDNPVENISTEQARSIYQRRIRNWKELGGNNEKILAFQRPADSGSQAVMQALVMGNQTMTKPIKEEYIGGMGELIQGVANYRNRHNSLGYSFRWYATVQFSSPDIKLLSLDGIEPTVENIRNRVYPVTAKVEAVAQRSMTE